MASPDPTVRSMVARTAMYARLAACDDLTAMTAPARKAFDDRFIRLARERFGSDIPEDELARRADFLRKEHFSRMALKSVQARRARRAARRVADLDRKADRVEQQGGDDASAA